MNENSNDQFAESTWISVAETALLLKIKPSTVIRRIQQGKIPFRSSPNLPFTYDGKPNYEVNLNAFPQRLQYQYLYAHLPESAKCSVDLISPRSKLGNIWMEELLDITAMIRSASLIKQKYHGTGQITEKLNILARNHGISLSTLYRILGKPATSEVSVLYTDHFYLQNHLPQTMCHWSCDFAYALLFDSSKSYSQNAIYDKLDKKRNKVLCIDCPYYPNKNSHSEIQCTKHGQFMIVPNHRKTINRFLKHIPHQMIVFAREGYRKWRADCGLFVKRERPLLTNENWSGDNHLFDLFIRIPVKKERNNRQYEKEIAVRPTLTAWMDSATGCIVGWVISVMPTSDTIAEAFCRAAVLKPDSPFRGLPQSVTIDCGKDYKSKLIEAFPNEQLPKQFQDTALNKRFAGWGILKALGTEVHHAQPYHPQSKPIERWFGTLEGKWISKLPGWCRSKPSERPNRFQKELNTLLKEKKLLTLEEFVSYFQNTILPEYHNSSNSESFDSDLQNWELSIESMSPMQKYQTFAKARDVTPDWNVISILMMHHKSNKKVGKWGIRFQNTYYQADELSAIVGDYVDFLYHSVPLPYAPSSITVIHNGNYLCEAFPAEKRHMTGDCQVDMMADSDRQHQPADLYGRNITQIRRTVHAILPDQARTETLDEFERNQMYDQTFAPKVEDNVVIITDLSDTSKENGTRNIQDALSFLFGDKEI